MRFSNPTDKKDPFRNQYGKDQENLNRALRDGRRKFSSPTGTGWLPNSTAGQGSGTSGPPDEEDPNREKVEKLQKDVAEKEKEAAAKGTGEKERQPINPLDALNRARKEKTEEADDEGMSADGKDKTENGTQE